jgi:hypothetical protein
MAKTVTTQMTIFAVALLGLTACPTRIETIRGPDGQEWMMCEGGPDRQCIAAMGKTCPNGYALSNRDKMFMCKPAPNPDQGSCTTDIELASAAKPGKSDSPGNPKAVAFPEGDVASPGFRVVRGPDCRLWIMCNSGRFGDESKQCLKILGDACPSGYEHSQVLGEDMYQCKSSSPPPKTDERDAEAPE